MLSACDVQRHLINLEQAAWKRLLYGPIARTVPCP